MNFWKFSFFCKYWLLVFGLLSCVSEPDHQIPELPDFDESYYEYAQEVVERSIARDPDNAEAHYRRAELLLKQNKPNNALLSISKALEIDENDPVYQLTYARALMDKGQNREAKLAAETARELGGKSVELYEILAQASLNSNYFREALLFSDSAIALAPQNPYNHYFKGKALAARLDTLAAEKSLLRSLQLGAQGADVYEALVDMYMNTGNYQKARYFMEKNLSGTQLTDRLRFQQAQILQRTGNPDSAANILYSLSTGRGISAYALNKELMQLYYQTREYDSAQRYAAKIVEMRPQDKLALLTEARILDRQRRYQTAINKYKAILEIDSLQQESLHKIAVEELDYLRGKVAYLWKKEQEKKLNELKQGLAPVQPISPQ